MNAKIEEIAKKLNKAKNIAVFCHVRPDGDALGGGLALYLALKNAGKNAVFACEDDVPAKFFFIPAMSEVKITFQTAVLQSTITLSTVPLRAKF